MKVAKLNAHNRRQIQRAGPRYTPGIEPGAPNIEIESLELSLSGLAFEQRFSAHVNRLATDLREAARSLPSEADSAFRKLKNTPLRVSKLLDELATATPESAARSCRALPRSTSLVRQRLSELRQAFDEQEQHAPSDTAKREIQGRRAQLSRTQSAVAEVVAFLESPPFSLLTTNSLLILGAWGTGKTHLLCDVTRRRMDDGLPTLFCLAQQLPEGLDPLDAICQVTGFAQDADSLLDALDRMGREQNERALLIVDGINEGDQERWKASLARLARSVRRYAHVGLVLSCRQPFDELIVTEHARKAYVATYHFGFTEVEFDAQVEYFTYYRIPIPHVPLLTDEFSRPLFLKILCETASRLTTNKKSRYVRDLASGQKGMTKVLEDFVNRVGDPVERDFGLQPRACWWLMKGTRTASGDAVGLAPVMAERRANYLPRSECLKMIRSATSFSAEDSARLLRRLVADGLLIESVRWRDREAFAVIELPYQRFSDHLIARHLLDRYLDTSNEAAIRRSFYVNRPLGAVFALRPHALSYAMPGLASAVMIEFPERTKRVLPDDDRELASYLPRARRLVAPLKDAFLDGVYWRPADSITRQTERLMQFLLEAGAYTRAETLEVLVSVATRVGHPWSAERLHAYLEPMTLTDRDLVWTEWIRQVVEPSVVFRLLEWIERSETMDADVAANCIRVTSLMLTTTRRPLRDRATRALFLLGLRHPAELFEATLRSLGFNDPYVPERLLAASYGIAMSYWSDPRGQHLRDSLPEFARALVDRMLVPGAAHATTHALMTDYAVGIVELARRVEPECIRPGKRRYAKQPLTHVQSLYPEPASIGSDVERVKSVLHMDFENYTLGRLVDGRGNYDYEHAEYKGVRRQILWRVAELGYSAERFADIDRRIAERESFGRGVEPAKTDRYGKKYSWISFFEVYGSRSAQGLLPEWRDERPSDADIDPSFPEAPPDRLPATPDVFTKAPTEPGAWLECDVTPDYGHLLLSGRLGDLAGPWVALDAHIQERAPSDPRRVFTFVWGRMMSAARVDEALERFRHVDFPGNSEIPRQGSDVYTFAGEIPWSRRFAPYLRSKSGRPLRNIEPAFPAGPWRKRDAVLVEVPVHDSGWESYHSVMNEAGHVTTLAPALSASLGLVNHRQDWDLYETDGRRATTTTTRRMSHGGSADLLCIRQDLLDRYLAETQQQLVLFIWGERKLEIDTYRPLRDELASKYQAYLNIHKRAYVYDSRKLRRRV